MIAPPQTQPTAGVHRVFPAGERIPMSRPTVGKTIWLLILTTASWFGAGALDLETPVTVTAWNGTVRWTVCSTTIEARPVFHAIDSVEVFAREGAFPTGGRVLEISTPAGPTLENRLPRRFRFPGDGDPPVGDWWVDETAAETPVFRTSADLGEEFTIRATLTGRHHQFLRIGFDGNPGFSCAFRRGFLNNDLFILDGEGEVIASGSLDPVLLDRLGAIVSTMLRAVSGGLFLLAVWPVFSRFRRTPADTPPVFGRVPFAAALALLALLGAGLAVWTAVSVFEGLPHLPDEIVYLLQARWLADGNLTGPEPPCPEYFNIPLTYFLSGRWIGHYPPAWPFLLTPGIAAGVPWLIPSMLRIPFIVIVGLLGVRLGGRWTGIAAAATAVVSPLALLLFGSLMPHTGSATLLLLGILLCLPRGRRTSKSRWIVAGLAFGAAFGMRPLTAVAVVLPLGIFLLGKIRAGERHPGEFGVLVISGILGAVPTLIANNLLTGSPWTFPYVLARGSMYSIRHLPFGLRTVDTLLAAMEPLVHGWGWPLIGPAAMQAIPFVFVAVLMLSGRSSSEDRLLAAIAAVVMLAHLGTRATGLHGFGPRYFFVPCAIVWLLTARGAAVLSDAEQRRVPAVAMVLGILILGSATVTPARLSLYRGYNDVTPAMTRAVAALPPCSLVLFPGDDWRGWAAAAPWLGRTDDHSAPAFAADFGETLGPEWCFPDRRIYRWDGENLHPVFDPERNLQ